MARYHGITDQTFERLILDAGAVYKNYGIPVWTVTLDTVIAGDQLVVNGVTFTGVAADPEANEFLIGVDDAATATNLALLIAALDGIASAVAVGAVITVTGETVLTNILITTPDTTMTITTNGLNAVLLGATRDGNTFTVETEYREIPIDGAKGPVKGGQRIARVIAKIAAKFIEITPEIIMAALPGSSASDYPNAQAPTHDEIRRALQIALTDYVQNVVIVGQVSGSAQPVVCGIENALSLGGFELAEADNDEAGIPIEFTAHFDPANLDTEPWFIRYPQDV